MDRRLSSSRRCSNCRRENRDKQRIIPRLVSHRMQVVVACMNRGDSAQALVCCEQLLLEAPDHPEVMRKIEGTVLDIMGTCCISLG